MGGEHLRSFEPRVVKLDRTSSTISRCPTIQSADTASAQGESRHLGRAYYIKPLRLTNLAPSSKLRPEFLKHSVEHTKQNVNSLRLAASAHPVTAVLSPHLDFSLSMLDIEKVMPLCLGRHSYKV